MNTNSLFNKRLKGKNQSYQIEAQRDAMGQLVAVLSNENVQIVIHGDDLPMLLKWLKKAREKMVEVDPMSTHYWRVKSEYPNAYARWTEEDDETLRQEYLRGVSVRNLSAQFQRHPKGIWSRLKKLNLITDDESGEAEDDAVADSLKLLRQSITNFSLYKPPIAEKPDPRWSVTTDNDLIDAYSQGLSIEQLAAHFRFSPEEIEQRLTKLAVL